jgi:hypothetical protein
VNALRVESIRRKEQQNESFSESNASSTGNLSVPNRIMEAEFDRLDKAKNGRLDVKELMQSKLRVSHFSSVGK